MRCEKSSLFFFFFKKIFMVHGAISRTCNARPYGSDERRWGMNLSDFCFAKASSPWEGEPMGVAWMRLLPQGRASSAKHSRVKQTDVQCTPLRVRRRVSNLSGASRQLPLGRGAKGGRIEEVRGSRLAPSFVMRSNYLRRQEKKISSASSFSGSGKRPRRRQPGRPP